MSNNTWMLTPTVRQTIAIIGTGFSGAMVAVHLLRSTRPLTIKLIERSATIGLGVAYCTKQESHLLNVPAGKMSAFVDDPNHFLRWLQLQQGCADRVTAQTFVPRMLYGHYVQTVLAEAEAAALPQVRLERVCAEAMSVQQHGSQAAIALHDGSIFYADRVVLALGNFAPQNPAIADSSFYQSSRYVRSAWSASASAIAVDQPVLLIGTGLTALDVVMSLHQQGHKGTIHLVSRRGMLPQTHQVLPASAVKWREELPNTTRTLLRRIRQEIELADDWRSVFDSLRSETSAIWQRLSLAERQRFLRHLRPYWETHRHRIAPAIAQTVTALRQTGQLIVHAGRIQAYREQLTEVEVVIQPRGSRELKALRVSTVVNCTSPTSDYRKIRHPLIRDLLNSGLIQPDALRLGLHTADNGALIHANGAESDWLYTLGSPRKGSLWETTAVPEIRQQAIALAQHLLQEHSPTPRSYSLATTV